MGHVVRVTWCGSRGPHLEWSGVGWDGAMWGGLSWEGGVVGCCGWDGAVWVGGVATCRVERGELFAEPWKQIYTR